MVTLSRLYVHPVKSMRGLELSHAQVLDGGLAFDRIFMITDPSGTFITARQYPALVCFTPALLINGVSLTAPDGQSRTVSFSDFSSDSLPTEVWGNHFTAHIAPEGINQWLSGYLKRDVQLRWVGPELTRRVKNRPEVPLGFADGFPYLLINEASFQSLQSRCPASLTIEQFRPNLIVRDAAPFAEDQWQTIRIGEVIFDLVKPCSRCILTTVNTQSGRKHPQEEPLHTLRQFRTAENGDVDFGQNMIARNHGVIRLGDSVEVLATHPPRVYRASDAASAVEQPHDAPKDVVISYGEHTFIGNNQQVLLEQLEQNGIQIPYSCRAGICGCCRITLNAGEVSPLRKGAIKRDGSVLACSCVPKTNVELA
ncbi:2Fe-2S ferredoxin YfaE [Leminorella richardii]|uniref:2Fe-2S ferredoxin YfaE n=1 Tax=Leminorella richardii TaxID=158841 RepID=A0A2X4UIZ1_9GAMM|nr:YcbX family protein [Leminorella richardii]SQI39846.1 2Fe-2S ferredoxin YfaE [Leminorella richardii]